MAKYSKEYLLKMRKQSFSRDISYDEIQAGINTDPDAFEITQEMIDNHEVAIRRGRGKQKAPTKIQKTVRFAPEVLEYFETNKSGWQKRLSVALTIYIAEHPRV